MIQSVIGKPFLHASNYNHPASATRIVHRTLGDQIVFGRDCDVPGYSRNNRCNSQARAQNRARESQFSSNVYLSEAFAAIALSFVASYFDVFKKSTYIPTPQYQPDWHVLFWAGTWAAIAGAYCAVKYVTIHTKEGEDFKSRTLAKDLEKEKVAVGALTRQRDLLVRITTFARQMVGRKIDRLSDVVSNEKVGINEFLEKLNPRLQISRL